MERLDAAECLLTMLGALDHQGGRLTPLGRQLLALPIHPRLGRLLIAAVGDGFLREGAALAALLSEKDIVPIEESDSRSRLSGRGSSDLLGRLDLLTEAERTRFAPRLRTQNLDPSGARRVAKVRDELLRIGRQLPGAGAPTLGEPDEEMMLRWVLLAYPDRVTRRRGGEETGVMVGGCGVRLAPESVVRDAEFFVAPRPARGSPGRDVRGAGPDRQRPPARSGWRTSSPSQSDASARFGSTPSASGSWV